MLRILCIYFSLSLCLLPNCIYNLFGRNVTTEQILFHISLGMDGVKGTDSSIIFPILKTALLPLLIIIVYLLFSFFLKRITKKYSNYKKSSFLRNIDQSVRSKKTPLFMIAFALIFLSLKTDIVNFIRVNTGRDFFSTMYMPPSQVSLQEPKNKKNLLIIYVESLEDNLKNKKLYGADLIEPIDAIKGIGVPKLYPAPGTGWSIAGMMSSQCAIPLKLHYGNFPHESGSFLPNVTCLSDILKGYGYKQYFLAGHHLGLSGTGNFYKSHGYDVIIGQEEWKEKNLSSDLFTGFGGGLNDDTLLAEAKKVIIENNKRNELYSLALITLDTHAKEGFPSPRCSSEEQSSGFRGAFRCSSKFVANFVNELQSENLLKNTVIILMGDHPFMESPDKSDLFPNPRYVYIKFIDPEQRMVTRDTMTHFDVPPSLLDLLGFLKDNQTKFGLGFSAFADIDKDSYEKYFKQVTHQKILYHSTVYDSFFFSR